MHLNARNTDRITRLDVPLVARTLGPALGILVISNYQFTSTMLPSLTSYTDYLDLSAYTVTGLGCPASRLITTPASCGFYNMG